VNGVASEAGERFCRVELILIDKQFPASCGSAFRVGLVGPSCTSYKDFGSGNILTNVNVSPFYLVHTVPKHGNLN